MAHEGPQLLSENVTEGVGNGVGIASDLLEAFGADSPQDGVGTPGDEECVGHHLDDGAACPLGDAGIGLDVALCGL